MLKVYNIVNQNFSVLYSIYSHYKIPCGAVRAGATKGHCCPTWTHTLQAPGHLCIPRRSVPRSCCPRPSARRWCGLSGAGRSLRSARADLSALSVDRPALCTPHEWSLGSASISVGPTGSPGSHKGSSLLCGTPGLGRPVCGSTRSLPGMSVHSCDQISFSAPSQGRRCSPSAFLLALPDSVGIFS